jgi:division protein CdvB (Snf7/Vps24/ESCRT-III family)
MPSGQNSVVPQPKIYQDLEILHKEISTLEQVLQPILYNSTDKLAGAAIPSISDLDSRLQEVISRLQNLSSRIRI